MYHQLQFQLLGSVLMEILIVKLMLATRILRLLRRMLCRRGMLLLMRFQLIALLSRLELEVVVVFMRTGHSLKLLRSEAHRMSKRHSMFTETLTTKISVG